VRKGEKKEEEPEEEENTAPCRDDDDDRMMGRTSVWCQDDGGNHPSRVQANISRQGETRNGDQGLGEVPTIRTQDTEVPLISIQTIHIGKVSTYRDSRDSEERELLPYCIAERGSHGCRYG